MASTSNYSTVTISSLVLDSMNTKLLGLVINKGELRVVNLKRGESKSVLNFTIRDSEYDSINATIWGDKTFIEELTSDFHMGDVVEIRNAIIQVKRLENSQFNPSVSSPYQLSFSETRGEIKLRCDLNLKYKYLLQFPPPSYGPILAIGDLIYSGDSVTGRQISLHSVIKMIGNVTEIVTKDCRHLKKLDLKVLDETYPSFTITLWGHELCEFAENYLKPKNVVLLCNLRIQMNNRNNTIMASSTSATLIVINPDMKGSMELSRYAAALDLKEGETDVTNPQNLPVCSVAEIVKGAMSKGQGEADFVGVVYGFLTFFDLDGPINNVIVLKCSICGRITKDATSTCSNEKCLDSPTSKPMERIYRINVTVTDQTGTIRNCTMKENVVRDLIGLELDQFFSLTDKEKTSLKWNYLFERCKFLLSVPYNGFARVLSCSKVNLEEIYA